MAYHNHDDFEILGAATGDFTISATGTIYSKEYGVGDYTEMKIVIKGTYANVSGATIDVVVQMYEPATETWHDHGTTFTQITADANEDKDFTTFGNKIRLKITSGGTFGGTEVVTFLAGAIVKGRN